MTPILTVTLNPALDLSTSVDAVVPEEKLRCTAPITDPGGGGVNVARAIRFLGGRATALVALGGHSGQRMRGLLDLEGIDVIPFETPGETRQSLAVMDENSGKQYRFVLPGPVWDTTLSKRGETAIRDAMPRDGLIVLSGSQPPGLTDSFPRQIAHAAEQRNARLLLDTSGTALHALPNSPLGSGHILRLDRKESENFAGGPLPDRAALAGFAATLVARGVAGVVVLAMGAEGSVLVTEHGAWHAVSPAVPVRSKVGAGDSFVGAFTLSLSQGKPAEAALSHGVAAASAAVMSDATALCRSEDVAELHQKVVLTRL